jgi:hypothetical protein
VVPVLSLWLPIVLAAVAVFVVSSLLHMVLRFHRTDYRPLPNEADVMAVLRRAGATPGLYHFPYASSPKEMGTPEMVAKLKEGPVGLMAVMPGGPMNMGKFLGLWFGYTVVVGIVIACIAGRTLPAGADRMLVACIVGSAAFLAYGLANVVDSIWKAYPWGVTAKHIIDGVLYSLATAAVFAWLWPS